MELVACPGAFRIFAERSAALIGGEMDIKEELKEIAANLYLIKCGAKEEDNKELIDRALFAVIRNIDRIVDKLEKDSF